MNNKNKIELILSIIVIILVLVFVFLNKETEFNLYESESEEQQLNNLEQENDELVEDSLLYVYFLDVGQGDCIFVQNENETMLIDAGNNPDGKYVSKYLRKELGIKKIDYLIGTHAHEDHIGGTDIIIQDFDIGTFYMPNKTSENKCYTDVIKYAKEKQIDIVSPNIGTRFNVGNATCEIMTKNDDAEDYNETSIVIEMNFGRQKFLFTGDMETENEESRKWDDIDVLKVAHHGSTYSTSSKFLNEIRPEIAVIMCSKNNDYYYPHEKLIERLEKSGCKDIYVTADEGTILITSDGRKNTVKSLKELSFDGNK
jgi:competence protein ComEC